MHDAEDLTQDAFLSELTRLFHKTNAEADKGKQLKKRTCPATPKCIERPSPQIAKTTKSTATPMRTIGMLG
jgi:hypothetical protein